MNLSSFRIDELEGHQIVSDVVHGTLQYSESISGHIAVAGIVAVVDGAGGTVQQLADARCALVATGAAADVAATRADIRARIDAGETTPVLASHLDALGLRDAVEQWARASE